jgi:hypothetical protein
MPKLAWTVVATGILGASGAARAEASPPPPDEPRVTTGEVLAVDVGSARGVAREWMVLPSGLELTGELTFVTADAALGGGDLALSDVGILTLRARTALPGPMELVAEVDLLPKQPSYTDEMIWQGGSLGLRVQIPDHQVAIALTSTGGPMLGDLGWWGSGGLAVEARKRLADIMTFRGSAGGTGTLLAPTADDRDRAWLVEAGLGGSVLFRDPWGKVGGWLGVGYAVPVAHDGDDPMSGEALDPQPRLDLHLGTVVALVDEWDVYIDAAVIDRGELDAMATRLPILDGGFDQRQLMIGISYHPKQDRDGTYAMAQY